MSSVSVTHTPPQSDETDDSILIVLLVELVMQLLESWTVVEEGDGGEWGRLSDHLELSWSESSVH